MLKRPLAVTLLCAAAVVAAVYYRHSLYLPSRPASIPADAFPCRFGFALRWISLGPPKAREIDHGATLEVYDAAGRPIDRANVTLAQPPRVRDKSQKQGFEAYPMATFRDFEVPPAQLTTGRGSGSSIDASHALVPWWWFK